MSKKNEIVITNYRVAWIRFKTSFTYKESSKRLKELGIQQPYRDNIIEQIFAEGWWGSNPKIKFIKLDKD